MHSMTIAPPAAGVRRGTLGAVAALVLAALPLQAPTGSRSLLEVVVQGAGSALSAAEAVTSSGGAVDEALPIVDGVSARVPA
ncbi:MAG: hypothetical protein M3134_08540, partial [Actinomycetota bacterium]|nr:hypothetical protein [Actinomycetota bacterium]